jgi:hypothetical protein
MIAAVLNSIDVGAVDPIAQITGIGTDKCVAVPGSGYIRGRENEPSSDHPGLMSPNRSENAMTDPPDQRGTNVPLTQAELDRGERIAGPEDPGAGEDYAGEPVADPWEEVPSGELDSGAVPGQPAN